jgi:hypothetical protein
MAFTRLTQDLNIIAKLDDEPNDEGGLTAAAFRAKFDEAGLAAQGFLNNTLIGELESAETGASGASNIGFAPTDGVSETNVQDAIENVQAQIAGVALGAIPDGSVTASKLADEAVTGDKMADEAVSAAHLASDLAHVRYYGKYSQMSGGAKCPQNGKIAFSSEDNDDFSAIDLETYNTRITIPAGVSVVQFYAYLECKSGARVTLYKNNSSLITMERNAMVGGYISSYGPHITPPLAVAEGDYFELYATVVTAYSSSKVNAGSVFGMKVLG